MCKEKGEYSSTTATDTDDINIKVEDLCPSEKGQYVCLWKEIQLLHAYIKVLLEVGFPQPVKVTEFFIHFVSIEK